MIPVFSGQFPPPSVGSVGAGSLHTADTAAAEKKDTLPAMMRVISRLWCHECSRVFADRIISDDGKNPVLRH